jgi:hypothetical protein
MDNMFEAPLPEAAKPVDFRASVQTVYNGFILEINGRAFVIQTDGHDMDDFESAVNALRQAYKICATKRVNIKL